MEKNDTILKKIKSVKYELPRKFIIENLINYSRSIDTVYNPYGDNFVLSQN